MEQHWSKDYIEHLRTVHLVMILLCTIGIAIACSPRKTGISQAHEQLDRIWDLVDNWNPSFLQSVKVTADTNALLPSEPVKVNLGPGKELSAQLYFGESPAFVTLDQPPTKSAGVITGSLNLTILPGESRDIKVNAPHGPEKPQSGSQANCKALSDNRDPDATGKSEPRPENIRDFQKVWDSLFQPATLHQPYELSPYFFARKQLGGEVEKLEIMPAAKIQSQIPRRVSLSILKPSPRLLCQMQQASGISPEYILFGVPEPDKPYHMYIPVNSMMNTPISAQALLLRGSSQGWHRNKFEDSFPELAELVEHSSKPLTLPEVAGSVAADEKRSPVQNFEAFGMKFDAGGSLYWAGLIILCVQFYLWVQLTEFSRKAQASQADTDIAWVGIYESTPARLLSFLSAVLLPFFTIGGLATRALWIHEFKWVWWPISMAWVALAIAGVVLAAILARRTYLLLQTIRSRPEALKKTAAAR